MPTYHEILQRNRKWVAETTAQDPEFFERLAREHKPTFLWIGCSDARVPADLVTQTQPGEMFVHRNIANQVLATCANTLAVLEYAVEALGVQDIIVCGHYGCGGVKAALEAGPELPYEHVNQWLESIRTTMRLHAGELDALRDDPERRAERLVELNVVEQVRNLSRSKVVREAWGRGQTLRLHGSVYRLRGGTLRDLDVTVSGPEQVVPAAPPSPRPTGQVAAVADTTSRQETRQTGHASDTQRDHGDHRHEERRRNERRRSYARAGVAAASAAAAADPAQD